MGDIRHVAVIDIGKTNAKLALVDLDVRTEITALREPNSPRTDGPYAHHDVESIWRFILDGLSSLNSERRIDAISVTTHGATAALVDGAGELVLPVLDYEFDGPDRMRLEYETVRPPFEETGSPALPLGLNLGAQLFWLQKSFPQDFARTRAILTYPQFWSHRLSGIAASEATSLGCHTDLWRPETGAFSGLVHRMGWSNLFPPIRRAMDVLGPVLPDISARTGLDPATPVVCGIHDSNASLLPHLVSREPPFSVVSTGTWVVAMAVGGLRPVLDPARDTLINVNAFGNAVPSARFMGGREFEMMMGDAARKWDNHDLRAVLSDQCMLLPAIQEGSGPFSGRSGGWFGREPVGGRRFVAASFYLALMTATCLELIGADGETVVEGPFAINRPFVGMLSAATGRPVVGQHALATGTSFGAALLASTSGVPDSRSLHAVDCDRRKLEQYARRWRGAAVLDLAPHGREAF